MKNQTNEISILENLIEALPERSKEVTFRLPAHLADLIESTRLQLDGQWESWASTLAVSALDHSSFAQCSREFEDLVVNSTWSFDDAADRARFMAPLLVALKAAHVRHQLIRS